MRYAIVGLVGLLLGVAVTLLAHGPHDVLDAEIDSTTASRREIERSDRCRVLHRRLSLHHDEVAAGAQPAEQPQVELHHAGDQLERQPQAATALQLTTDRLPRPQLSPSAGTDRSRRAGPAGCARPLPPGETS